MYDISQILYGYDDPEERFSVLVPDGWESGLGEISNSRRTVVFYPRGVPPAEVNVSVVITNVSVEFTRLGSFGNVATFAVALGNNGRYNRLYTLTAQCGEEQVAQWGPLLRQIVASFKPDVPPTA
ncbi:oxygen-evolving enhancer PsbP [Haematococcus lacustris]|uniref:Oxygen-evolving enhancer PsbP n=1 Tax=Haematococcus lacustris TaxID=44745 RepID=A0A699ZFZ8_HAELA|nr:oxygen-evolving enhancer PsbP [Haematococcus lacustris]